MLTDYEHQVLMNLRTCMHMNTAAVAAQSAAHQQEQQQQGSTEASAAQSYALHGLLGGSSDEDEATLQQHRVGVITGHVSDQDLFGDADSVDDFDLLTMMGGGNSSSDSKDTATVAAGLAAQLTAWDAENMCVRHLDWQESSDALQSGAAAAACQVASIAGVVASCSSTCGDTDAVDNSCCASNAPSVPCSQQYSVILGDEVMYEPQHAQLVAAAIKHRLQPGGRALLCCAVRDQGVFDTFSASCWQWGLRYRAVRVQPDRDEDLGGIHGRERDYEGGYLLMAVDHAAAPATDWHRNDFEDIL